jgi:hypothetical protein
MMLLITRIDLRGTFKILSPTYLNGLSNRNIATASFKIGKCYPSYWTNLD